MHNFAIMRGFSCQKMIIDYFAFWQKNKIILLVDHYRLLWQDVAQETEGK